MTDRMTGEGGNELEDGWSISSRSRWPRTMLHDRWFTYKGSLQNVVDWGGVACSELRRPVEGSIWVSSKSVWEGAGLETSR